MIKKVFIKKGRDESIIRFHPWVFSGAIYKMDEGIFEGEVVEVVNYEGTFLAYGHYQLGSITVRILAFDNLFLPMNGSFREDFWYDRIYKALQMRNSLQITPLSNCYRLIHGEGDFLPGLIIDYYDGVAVMQSHSAGMYLSREIIAAALKRCYGEKLLAIYDKSEGTAPFKAGLNLRDGYLFNSISVDGKHPIINGDHFVIENGHKFIIDWETGQKTGFFLDQRDNRALVGRYSQGRRVLNLFCYTGGFSIYALASGAERVVSVDSSKSAVLMTDRNVDLNFKGEHIFHTSVCNDAIDYLKGVNCGDFDMIIVDPPAFAKHRGAINNALRAYRRLNSYAIEKVAPGGVIFTYSCSQVVDKQMFALTVFSAAAQVGRRVRILDRLTQPSDHPVNIYHPEGEYLKGLLLYVE